jgi:hypothetical protein
MACLGAGISGAFWANATAGDCNLKVVHDSFYNIEVRTREKRRGAAVYIRNITNPTTTALIHTSQCLRHGRIMHHPSESEPSLRAAPARRAYQAEGPCGAQQEKAQ